jgi:hypothetical protein
LGGEGERDKDGRWWWIGRAWELQRW